MKRLVVGTIWIAVISGVVALIWSLGLHYGEEEREKFNNIPLSYGVVVGKYSLTDIQTEGASDTDILMAVAYRNPVLATTKQKVEVERYFLDINGELYEVSAENYYKVSEGDEIYYKNRGEEPIYVEGIIRP